MMKVKLLTCMFLLTGFLIYSCNSVKNQKEMASGKPDSASMAEMKKPVFKYDERGNITERRDVSFMRDGRIRSRNTYQYKFDERNNRTEELSMSFDTTGRRILKNICTFKYNTSNQKIETVFVSFNEQDLEISWLKDVYTYDKNGFENSVSQYQKDGSKTTSMQRVWSEKGELKEEIYYTYNPDGSVKEKKGIVYGEKGNVIKTY